MKLNFYTEYALRVLIYLSLYPDQVIATRAIAEKYEISVNHLNKVSQRLVSLGFVASTRGKGGGIQLIPSSMELKLGEIISLLEPQIELAQCSGGGGIAPCVLSSMCQLRDILANAQREFWNHLNQYTLRDLTQGKDQEMKKLFEAL